MTHPIIKTDNYILITSDEEIKEGDYWHYLGEKDNPVKNVLGKSWFEKLHDVKMYKKVIAHLPLNNQPILEGVPLLPPLPNEEDYVEKLVNNYVQELVECKSVKESERTWISAICHQSITKAKEKYKFTEEDIKYMFECGRNYQNNAEITFKMSMEYLTQPKLPVGFNCRIEYLTSSPKIINGVMQVEWIFE